MAQLMSETKPPLDSRVIRFVGDKVFQCEPLKPSRETYKDVWQDCIIGIDNQARDIKRRIKNRNK